MTECIPWRSAPDAVVQPLLMREIQRWRTDLAWDLDRDWRDLDAARREGRVHGWLAVDATGEVRGWTFYVDPPSHRMVGALVAADVATTRRLVAAVTDVPVSTQVTVFVRDAAPGSTGALWRARARLERYDYLVCPTDRLWDPQAGATFDAWTGTNIEEAAGVLREAYRTDVSVRPFAPGGTAVEWREYLHGLVHQPGCGVFQPAASVAASRDGRLEGLVVTTSIAPGVSHLAQVAVAPDARGRGLAAAMIAQAALASGSQCLTLCVAVSNVPARRLYHRLGFTSRGHFLSARRSALSIHQHCA